MMTVLAPAAFLTACLLAVFGATALVMALVRWWWDIG